MTSYKKYGLLGRVLGHSLSPQIHELIFKHTQLKGEYLLYPMEPSEIKEFVLNLSRSGFTGLNVTIPYKNDVIPFLDSISEEANKIGSVNTIMPSAGKLIGYNSDYFGVKKMLEKASVNIDNKRVMVLGSGGSARTVVALLEDSECNDILLVSRDKIKAKEKFSQIETAEYGEIDAYHDYDILINTTPVGMYPKIDGCPLGEDIIKGFSAVVDLIYNPEETKLLQIAKKHGIIYTNGLYMLVAQAIKSQEIWNNISISNVVLDMVYNEIKEAFANER